MNSFSKIRLQLRPDEDAGYIFIQLEHGEEDNGKVIHVGLENESTDFNWSYSHVLQATKGLLITGIDDGMYVLRLKQDNEDLLNIDYKIEVGEQKPVEMKGIPRESTTIEIDIGKDVQSRQFGGAFGGALLTSGSFTMMAASGGF